MLPESVVLGWQASFNQPYGDRTLANLETSAAAFSRIMIMTTDMVVPEYIGERSSFSAPREREPSPRRTPHNTDGAAHA